MLRSNKYSAADKAMIWGRYFEIAVDPDGTLQMEAERRARASGYVLALLSEKRREAARNINNDHDYEGQGWKKYAKDLGVHDTYDSGVLVRQRLYAIKDFPGYGDESDPNSHHYIQGANGLTIVSAKGAPNAVILDRLGDKLGKNLYTISSWRSDPHQEELAAGNSNRSEVAAPGYSGHQNGLSLDIGLDGYSSYSASSFGTRNGLTTSVDNPRIAPNSELWRFVEQHGPKIGIHRYFYEPWHKDIEPMPYRELLEVMQRIVRNYRRR